ncbi:MAG: DUF3084 domain-containing protein [Fimbriimonadaceae bacterium]|nr:DUF3084 domain-containing protein [Fimbriimonadaceae bacterium]
MDPLSIGFVGLMILLAGVVAWLGDLIGRRIGKKRLKLGGLRPKHTAALVTILAGSMGTLAVVLFLAAVSEPVRTWILTGNRTREQLVDLRRQQDREREALEAAQKARAEAEAEIGRVRARLTAEEKKVKSTEEENRRLAAANKDLDATQKRLTRDIQARQTRVTSLTGEVARARQTLAATRKQVDDQTKSAEKARLDSATINAENLRLTLANTALERERDTLEKARNGLQAEVTEFKKSLDELSALFEKTSLDQRAELRRTLDELEAAQQELVAAEAELDNVSGRLTAVQQEAVALMALGQAARVSRMVIGRGDELTRLAVPPQLTQAEARQILNAAIQKARVAALDRGARPISPGLPPAQFIDLREASADRQQESLVLRLAGNPEPTVLILRALVNSFEQEFVPLDAIVYRNPIVFRPGEVLATTRLDGRLTENEIAGRVAEFAQTELRDVVLRRGLIPAQGAAAPLGEMPREAILRMVKQVKERGALVRVQFLAQVETRAGDALKVDFRLR